MNATEIITNIQTQLLIPVGRHLYGVLGTYPALDAFANQLQTATLSNGQRFPAPLSVTTGILKEIPDEEFHELALHEAQAPEPVRSHVKNAFERFLRASLRDQGLVVLAQLEMLFAYALDFSPLRSLISDDARAILLLPGRRDGDRLILFPEADLGSYFLPPDLIANNHLWELT